MKRTIYLYQGDGIGPELFEALRAFFILSEPFVHLQWLSDTSEIAPLPKGSLLLCGPQQQRDSWFAHTSSVTVHLSTSHALTSRVLSLASASEIQRLDGHWLQADKQCVLIHNTAEAAVEWEPYLKQWSAMAFKPSGAMLEDANIYTFIRQGGPFKSPQVITDNYYSTLLNALYASAHHSYTTAYTLFTSEERTVATPLHGHAPDIAGMGIASPIPLILGFSALLKQAEVPQMAQIIENQIKKNLIEYPDHTTPDLGGVWNTQKYIRMMAESVNLQWNV